MNNNHLSMKDKKRIGLIILMISLLISKITMYGWSFMLVKNDYMRNLTNIITVSVIVIKTVSIIIHKGFDNPKRSIFFLNMWLSVISFLYIMLDTIIKFCSDKYLKILLSIIYILFASIFILLTIFGNIDDKNPPKNM